jgi:RNase_H superfamily
MSNPIKLDGLLTIPDAASRTATNQPATGRLPKVVTIDIETSPNVVYAWGLWDQNISISQIVDPTRVISFAAKWLDGKTEFYSEHHNTREEMVLAAWRILNEADWVVTYNGISFDQKHLNREFVTAGLTPPSPYKSVDLLRTAKAQFKFPSNKLDWVAQVTGRGKKVKHDGQALWNAVLQGDAKAWKTMRTYNIHDVKLTEELFLYLLPWIKGLPNLSLWTGKVGCYACGSEHLDSNGWHRAVSNTYERLLCQDCGAWNRKTIVAGRIKTRAL